MSCLQSRIQPSLSSRAGSDCSSSHATYQSRYSMRSTPPLSLATGIAALDRHYRDTIVPLWRSTGWNMALNLPYEALSGATGLPLQVERYRAMACARQLLVFSQAGLPGKTPAIAAPMAR